MIIFLIVENSNSRRKCLLFLPLIQATFFLRQKKHVSSFTSWRNSSDFISPPSDLFGHGWTGTKNSETMTCFVSCVAAILIKNDVLLSSLGMRDCVQKWLGLNSQIYKYQNVAQQLIQTHYFMIHMFSEGYPNNLLYSTFFFLCSPNTHNSCIC